jgi:hypothetical protein
MLRFTSTTINLSAISTQSSPPPPRATIRILLVLLKEFNAKLNPTITYNNIQTTLFLACKNIISISLSIVTYHLNTHCSPHHPCCSPQSPPSAGYSTHPFHSMQIIPQASSTINRPPPTKQIVWQYQQDCLPAPDSPQISQFFIYSSPTHNPILLR